MKNDRIEEYNLLTDAYYGDRGFLTENISRRTSANRRRNTEAGSILPITLIIRLPASTRMSTRFSSVTRSGNIPGRSPRSGRILQKIQTLPAQTSVRS